MKLKKASLNNFLVDVFHQILRVEENSLSQGDFANLSVREMHVIDAVCLAQRDGTGNKAMDIAKRLNITASTLTITVSALEKKGYLLRQRDEQDKRVVRILPTEDGRRATVMHDEFHEAMVEQVVAQLDEEELHTLIRALETLSVFFQSNPKFLQEMSE